MEYSLNGFNLKRLIQSKLGTEKKFLKMPKWGMSGKDNDEC